MVARNPDKSQTQISRRRAGYGAIRLDSPECALTKRPLRVLFIGSERPEEFREALALGSRGNQVVVVNPKETDAARRFRLASGRFLAVRIEDLPPHCGSFDFIRENYPYPSGRHYVPPRPFALARLRRLAPNGRWILYTEAARFATLLKAVVYYRPRISQRFEVQLTRVPLDTAPPSDYPPTTTRYRLTFRRVR
jgi:hypothetical protein